MSENIEVLKGKILTGIVGKVGDEEMMFTTDDGEKYRMFHYQDCCESVTIEDIVGDLNDLVGSPIIEAEEVSHASDQKDLPDDLKTDSESYTWTFYKLGTAKGFVTIRWFGESNGYYSEGVDFKRIFDNGPITVR
jgi:hypothetical protein